MTDSHNNLIKNYNQNHPKLQNQHLQSIISIPKKSFHSTILKINVFSVFCKLTVKQNSSNKAKFKNY